MCLSLHGVLLGVGGSLHVVSLPVLVRAFSPKAASEPSDSYLNDQGFKGKCPKRIRRKLCCLLIT